MQYALWLWKSDSSFGQAQAEGRKMFLCRDSFQIFSFYCWQFHWIQQQYCSPIVNLGSILFSVRLCGLNRKKNQKHLPLVAKNRNYVSDVFSLLLERCYLNANVSLKTLWCGLKLNKYLTHDATTPMKWEKKTQTGFSTAQIAAGTVLLYASCVRST